MLAPVPGGAFIVNRMDYAEGTEGGREIGIGFEVLETSGHEDAQVHLMADIAAHRHALNGPGVTVIDGGANIGTHTVRLANLMLDDDGRPWGKVIAFEPQEWPYYALCGNLALNNAFNASAARAALGSSGGTILVPILDPRTPHNYGGTQLRESGLIGVKNPVPQATVPRIAIDALTLERLDILKLDIEGMEPDALDGARDTIRRLRPVIIIEWTVCGKEAIEQRLPGYHFQPIGMELVAIHKADPLLQRLQLVGGEAA